MRNACIVVVIEAKRIVAEIDRNEFQCYLFGWIGTMVK